MTDIQVPTALSGVVTKLAGMSFCMDGATNMIHSSIGSFRLKGSNPEASKALALVEDGKQKVTVMANPVLGPECMYLSVYDVIELAEAIRVFSAGIDTWPWNSMVRR